MYSHYKVTLKSQSLLLNELQKQIRIALNNSMEELTNILIKPRKL